MSTQKERPILMSALMVRAILEGRKTQTRRVIKPAPRLLGVSDGREHWTIPNRCDGTYVCPYGQPGDRLWVRETFCAESYASKGWSDVWYDADNSSCENDWPVDWSPPVNTIKTHREEGENIPMGGFNFYRAKIPSIYMPRWASRITLEITAVRVERLNDISERDSMAEGCEYEGWRPTYNDPDSGGDGNETMPSESFMKLWESINGAESWNQNPWVWVIEFKVVGK